MSQDVVWEKLIDTEIQLRNLKERYMRLEEAYTRARNLIVELQDQVEGLLSSGDRNQCLRCKKEKSAGGLLS